MSSPEDNTEAAPPAGRGASDRWSVAEILDASSELLAHFGRSGIRFLPQSRDAAVAAWADCFVAPIGEPVIDAAASGQVRHTETLGTAVPTPPVVAVSGGAAAPAAVPKQMPVPSRTASSPYPGAALPLAERSERLNSLAQRVAVCTRCPVLAGCRTQTVFGDGPANPRFVFLGEGPGAEEDKAGRPFVGKAGQLLTKMIEAMRLSRDDVYLLDTVKCRPPTNRNPEPDEVASCREYLEAQLNLLRPEYIVCLGAVSSQALLQTKSSIGQMRQRFHQYHSSKVLVIYHPTYLLRNPDAKKAAWADLQMLMKDAGL